MDTITDYKIIVASTAEALSEMVDAELEDGWQPLGGPSVSRNNNLMQAVVKYAGGD